MNRRCGFCGRALTSDLNSLDAYCPNHLHLHSAARLAVGWKLIPASRLDGLKAAMAALNRKAEKLHIQVAPLAVEEGQHYVIYIPESPPVIVGQGEHAYVAFAGRAAYHVEYVAVKVQGEPPRLNGWLPVAKVEPVPEKNVAFIQKFAAAGDADIPDEYRERAQKNPNPECDHCQLNRARKTAYLLRHDDGRVKQVGSTCLKDYTGHPDAEALANLAAQVGDLLGRMDGDWDPDQDRGFGGYSAPRVWPAEEFLANVHAAIQKFGWVSRASQQDRAEPVAPTVDRVLVRLGGMGKLKPEEVQRLQKEGQWFNAAPENYDAARAMRVEMRAVLADKERLSDYEYNLKVALEADVVALSVAGVVASVFAQAEKYRTKGEADAEEQARLAALNHVGVEAQMMNARLKFMDYRVITPKKEAWERNAFAPDKYYLLVFEVVPSREIVKHFASQKITYIDGDKWRKEASRVYFGGAELLRGNEYDARFRVKRHMEYRGVRETMVSHLNLKYGEQAAAKAHRVAQEKAEAKSRKLPIAEYRKRREVADAILQENNRAYDTARHERYERLYAHQDAADHVADPGGLGVNRACPGCIAWEAEEAGGIFQESWVYRRGEEIKRQNAERAEAIMKNGVQEAELKVSA